MSSVPEPHMGSASTMPASKTGSRCGITTGREAFQGCSESRRNHGFLSHTWGQLAQCLQAKHGQKCGITTVSKSVKGCKEGKACLSHTWGPQAQCLQAK
jgi:hypothetical protein